MAPYGSPDLTNGPRSGIEQHWLDAMKAVALFWVFLNHAAERIFGFPYFANPNQQWPPLSERVGQLAPIAGHGPWDVPLNILRYLGWSGDQGVQLFLIISGFGLTWGLLAKGEGRPLSIGAFYLRRFERIYPLWWGVHLLVLPLRWLSGEDWIDAPDFWLSLLGLRLSAGSLYILSPAWWYVALLIQLYLVYPLLWELLRRKGLRFFLLSVLTTAFIVRGLGLFWFSGYLDAWSRGAIFITRLPEFAFGMAFAVLLRRYPDAVLHRLRSIRWTLCAVAGYILGITLSFSLGGMTFAPFLLGVSAFVVLLRPLDVVGRSKSSMAQCLRYVGKHSFSLYLVHGLAVSGLVPRGLSGNPVTHFLQIGAALALTLVAAVVLEAVVGLCTSALHRWHEKLGVGRTAAGVAVAIAALFAGAAGAEFAVRKVNPQEVLGWGERPSLEPHGDFGWRLTPNRQTRLRWEHYDYTVKANSLGFPGAEYPADRPPGTLRILTIGDAFTSAEGVDTDDAWPRLLERELRRKMPHRDVQVLNFAITGYGPDQYAAVVKAFVPALNPDLLIVEMFVNDYQDALTSPVDFQRSIGFGNPDPEGWRSFVRLTNLRKLLRSQVLSPLAARLQGRPSPPYGYFLGNFAALESDNAAIRGSGKDRVIARLSEIEETARKYGTQVIVVMVPAAVQVCRAEQLAYFPRNANLSNPAEYDVDLPQRVTKGIAESLGVEFIDLRSVLSAEDGRCLYHARNMHWTREGHKVVSGFMAEAVLARQQQ